MSRLRRMLLVALLTLLTALSLWGETIIVADIEDRTGQLKPEVLEASRGLLEQAYRASGKHQVLPVSSLRKFVADQKKWKDCYGAECQIAAATALKADLVLGASIDFFAGIYTMTVSLVNAKTKQKNEAGAADFNGTAVGMKGAIEKLAPALTGKKMAAAPAAVPAPATPAPAAPPPPSDMEKKYRGAAFQSAPKVETYAAPIAVKEPEIKKADNGGVSFTSQLAAVKILFAKGKKEEKTCTAPCTVTNLEPGDYVARFEKDGFSPMEEAIRIEAGKTIPYAIQLTSLIAEKAKLSEELIEAAKNGDIKEMRRLFVLGADVNYRNAGGYGPLLVAALSGQTEAATILIARGAKFSDVEIGTLLLMVVETNNLALFRLMLSQATDFNYRYDEGRTILWLAVEKQRWSIFDQLVKSKKVDTGIKDNSGMTILMWTIENGMEKVADMLKNYGLKLPPDLAARALRNSVAKENILKLRTLLPFVTNINPVYEDGLTPRLEVTQPVLTN
ncbi:MAG TPA: ankyrin repeat domain-containing protein, partial [bacterium]|nr:ankyrin repeat domain-containing protein [bacterium]